MTLGARQGLRAAYTTVHGAFSSSSRSYSARLHARSVAAALQQHARVASPVEGVAQGVRQPSSAPSAPSQSLGLRQAGKAGGRCGDAAGAGARGLSWQAPHAGATFPRPCLDACGYPSHPRSMSRCEHAHTNARGCVRRAFAGAVALGQMCAAADARTARYSSEGACRRRRRRPQSRHHRQTPSRSRRAFSAPVLVDASTTGSAATAATLSALRAPERSL